MKATTGTGAGRVRVTKDPSLRREELLDIAWELGRTHGFEALRVEQIVQTAGVAKGTFYHYFAAKDDVMEALIQRFADGLFTELSRASAAASDADTARMRLEQIMDAATAYKLSQPDLSYASVLYSESNLPLRQRLFRAWRERSREVLLPVIEAGAADGSFTVMDAAVATDIMLLMWFEAADQLWNRAVAANDADEFAHILLSGGIAIREAQARILGMPSDSFTIPDDPSFIDRIKELYLTLDRNPS
ncbi:MAG TPA: TetR/AcrR family transcriptional regulator [Propionicimonas sp.]|jgi:AcrR family transcriptional regulator|nr:TetR/AcrR family transcriptional regulator [Propionicimonas sp.]